MRDANNLLVGGQLEEDKTGEELARAREEEDRERQALIGAWKAMYRRKGIDPDTYHIDWDKVAEASDRGE